MASKKADPTIATSLTKIAATHQFSSQQEAHFRASIESHAAVLATVDMGNARNAVYPAHTDEIIQQFVHQPSRAPKNIRAQVPAIY